MRPYSQDLREKIVGALEGDNTQEEVADRFSVSRSFIEQLWRKVPHDGQLRGTAARRRPGANPASA